MSAPEPSEQALVERAKRDPEAFGQLYDIYFPRIYSFIYRRAGDQATAEDLTSETFLKALRSIGQYRYTGQPFSAWLFRIATNVIADHFRRNRGVEPLAGRLPVPDGAPGPEEAALREDRREAILRALAELTPEQQDVVLLRFEQGFRLREIAGLRGKTEGAVKALMFRALHSLREKLEERGVRL